MDLDRATKEEINNKMSSIGLDPIEAAKDKPPTEEATNSLKFRLTRPPFSVKGVPTYILRNALNKKIIEDSNGAASLYTIELDSEANKLGTSPELVESNAEFDTRMPIDPSRYYILEMNPDSGRLSVTDNKLGYETKDQAIEFKYRNPKEFKTKVNKGSTILHRSPDRYKVMLDSNFSESEKYNKKRETKIVGGTLAGAAAGALSSGAVQFVRTESLASKYIDIKGAGKPGREFLKEIKKSMKSPKNKKAILIGSILGGATVGYKTNKFLTKKYPVCINTRKPISMKQAIYPDRYYVIYTNDENGRIIYGNKFGYNSKRVANKNIAEAYKDELTVNKGSTLLEKYPDKFSRVQNFSRFETNEYDDKLMIPSVVTGQIGAAYTRDILGRGLPNKFNEPAVVKTVKGVGRTIPSLAVGAGVGYGTFLAGKRAVNALHNKDNNSYMQKVTRVDPSRYYVVDVVNQDYFSIIPGVSFNTLAEGNYFVAATHRKPKGQFECHKGSVLVREFPKRFVV